jgi:hypothetical protein
MRDTSDQFDSAITAILIIGKNKIRLESACNLIKTAGRFLCDWKSACGSSRLKNLWLYSRLKARRARRS